MRKINKTKTGSKRPPSSEACSTHQINPYVGRVLTKGWISVHKQSSTIWYIWLDIRWIFCIQVGGWRVMEAPAEKNWLWNWRHAICSVYAFQQSNKSDCSFSAFFLQEALDALMQYTKHIRIHTFEWGKGNTEMTRKGNLWPGRTPIQPWPSRNYRTTEEKSNTVKYVICTYMTCQYYRDDLAKSSHLKAYDKRRQNM